MINDVKRGARQELLKVAAVHAASVPFDVNAGVDKACRLISEAAGNGAELVVFPESFIPVFPLWNALVRPIEGHGFFRRMAANALEVPGPEISQVAEAAAGCGTYVSLGFTEVSPDSSGCLWNSNVLIGSDGNVLNHHRKLVPTFYEKLTWACGDGAGLRVISTPIGRIGGLICGENNNTLARYTLIAQGEEVHTACYPPAWPFRNNSGDSSTYDLAAAIRLRAGAHSFEAKCYTVVGAGFLDEATIDAVTNGDSQARELLQHSPRTAAMISGPSGEILAEGSTEKEDVVYATIDLGILVEHKQHHDMAGYYNRLDIFDVQVDRERRRPVRFRGEGKKGPDYGLDATANEANIEGQSAEEASGSGQYSW